jgi:aspartokinase/homoserine dehydrogenase 1
MKILKFGGTSVGSPARIKCLAELLTGLHKRKEKFAVVLSAFSGVTDDLLQMSLLASLREGEYLALLKKVEKRHVDTVHELISGKHKTEALNYLQIAFSELHNILHGVYLLRDLSARTLDYITGFGERLSAFVISQYLKEMKLKANFLDARNVILTDDQFGSAHVNFAVTNSNIRSYFRKSKEIQVITGFIGSTDKNETTTLGRGGSDYTAAIFGAALDATEIQIWTDVDGVMTADPRKVKKAFSVSAMTFEEAMEMSHFGAKVIHPPTIQPVLEKKIPLVIRNSFNPSFPGTFISEKASLNGYMVKGISSIDQVTLLTMQGSGMVGVAGISARLFGALATCRVNVIMITQGSSEHTISFAVKPEDGARSKRGIEEIFNLEIKAGLIEKIKVEENLSIVAVIGENMKNTPGVSGRLFQSLGKNGISVVATAQGSSELNISVVIHKGDLNKSLNALHQAFFLSDTRVLHVFLAGVGLIGSTLINQVKKQSAHLKANKSLEIKLIGIANSRKMLFDEQGISFTHFREHLSESDTPMSMDRFVKNMQKLNLPQSVFVDCTSNEEITRFYSQVLDSSISIITPNKIANSGSYENYSCLRNSTVKRNVKFLYETNVGAGLPVINTLNDLMHSGDKIIKIEAVLSGTLSFIFNTFDKDRSFSSVVMEAMERGYTEPDPRVDLSGLDVARKLLILSRETGIRMELKQISIENILPDACKKAATIDQFFEQLKLADAHFEKIRRKAEVSKKVLRFIASLQNDKAAISLQAVDSSHPFFNLSGSDNIVSFTTERYKDRPLVIKGPGAGAEVTAAGVFSEIISISNYFE